MPGSSLQDCPPEKPAPAAGHHPSASLPNLGLVSPSAHPVLWEERWQAHTSGRSSGTAGDTRTPCSLEWQLVMSHKWVSHLWAGGSTSPIDTVATNMLSVFLIPFGSKSIQFLRSLSTSVLREMHSCFKVWFFCLFLWG